jgi:hypothetical protein
MMMDEIKKKLVKKKQKKPKLIWLTCKTRDLGNETVITP